MNLWISLFSLGLAIIVLQATWRWETVSIAKFTEAKLPLDKEEGVLINTTARIECTQNTPSERVR